MVGRAVADDPDRGLGWLGDEIDVHQAIGDMTGLDLGDDGFQDAYDALKAEAEELIRRPRIWSAIEALAALPVECHAVDSTVAMSIIDPILIGFPDHS
jgi:hypothetical protein